MEKKSNSHLLSTLGFQYVAFAEIRWNRYWKVNLTAPFEKPGTKELVDPRTLPSEADGSLRSNLFLYQIPKRVSDRIIKIQESQEGISLYFVGERSLPGGSKICWN